jgi:hypothetical protein
MMKQAPSAKHGKHYKKHMRKHATNDKDFRLFNMINQTPEMAARTAANVGYRQMFLSQQHALNAKAEVSRLSGYLMNTGNARRDDRCKDYTERKNEGYAHRLATILGPMVSKTYESKPIIGAEGTYKD